MKDHTNKYEEMALTFVRDQMLKVSKECIRQVELFAPCRAIPIAADQEMNQLAKEFHVERFDSCLCAQEIELYNGKTIATFYPMHTASQVVFIVKSTNGAKKLVTATGNTYEIAKMIIQQEVCKKDEKDTPPRAVR